MPDYVELDLNVATPEMAGLMLWLVNTLNCLLLALYFSHDQNKNVVVWQGYLFKLIHTISFPYLITLICLLFTLYTFPKQKCGIFSQLHALQRNICS